MSELQVRMHYRLSRPRFEFEAKLAIPLAGITGIFGPSGAGKTTLLRCIAGLERAEEGSLVVAGETWQDERAGVSRPAHERDIGYVFQEPRLFGHLDVRANLLYGARRVRGAKSVANFDGVVGLLGLGERLDSRPQELSGGEAQRVAIGRALLRAPRFILMDEPLAALDAARRDEILPFLERLHAESATPIVYVSHNIDEICRLCDHLAVMDGGRIVADGGLQEVLTRLDVPQLRGEEAGSVIEGDVEGFDAEYELTRLRLAGGELLVPGMHATAGSRLRLRIRANDVSLCRERPRNTTILNILQANIEAIDNAPGASRLVRLAIGSDRLLARITRRSCDDLGLRAGEDIHAQIKAVAVRGR